MKNIIKVFAVISVMFIALNVNAQNHIEFMKIPMEGSIEQFGKKLERKLGYELRSEKPTMRTYDGMFLGEEAVIGIFGIAKVQQAIAVIECSSEEYAADFLLKAIDIYCSRYPDFIIKDDNYVFKTNGGLIIISLGNNKNYVTIGYMDDYNYEYNKKVMIESL